MDFNGDELRPDSRDNLDAMIAVSKHGVADSGLCPAVREGETVVVVEGLPGVSRIYSSAEGNVSVEGWSLDEGGYDQTVGRCYVDQDHLFRTNIVHSGTFDGSGADSSTTTILDGPSTASDEPDRSLSVLTTIDMATTGGGDFAAAVREVGRSNSEDLAFSYVVTHNYNPGSGAVKASFDVWDRTNWTGVVVFTSTGEAETYNDREFSPWTDTQYLGSPNYDFKITLICK